MTDRAWLCPNDATMLTRVGIRRGATGVCPDCRGVWLPRDALRILAREKGNGWRGYVHFEAEKTSAGPCPIDGTPLVVYKGSLQDVVHQCSTCGGLWLPGDLLNTSDERERTRRHAGDDDLLSPLRDSESMIIRDVSTEAGWDPRVVQDLLDTSFSVWSRAPRFL